MYRVCNTMSMRYKNIYTIYIINNILPQLN